MTPRKGTLIAEDTQPCTSGNGHYAEWRWHIQKLSPLKKPLFHKNSKSVKINLCRPYSSPGFINIYKSFFSIERWARGRDTQKEHIEKRGDDKENKLSFHQIAILLSGRADTSVDAGKK